MDGGTSFHVKFHAMYRGIELFITALATFITLNTKYKIETQVTNRANIFIDRTCYKDWFCMLVKVRGREAALFDFSYELVEPSLSW